MMYVIAALQNGNVFDGSFLFQKSVFFILKREDPCRKADFKRLKQFKSLYTWIEKLG
jgi:hypothetical protein